MQRIEKGKKVESLASIFSPTRGLHFLMFEGNVFAITSHGIESPSEVKEAEGPDGIMYQLPLDAFSFDVLNPSLLGKNEQANLERSHFKIFAIWPRCPQRGRRLLESLLRMFFPNPSQRDLLSLYFSIVERSEPDRIVETEEGEFHQACMKTLTTQHLYYTLGDGAVMSRKPAEEQQVLGRGVDQYEMSWRPPLVLDDVLEDVRAVSGAFIHQYQQVHGEALAKMRMQVARLPAAAPRHSRPPLPPMTAPLKRRMIDGIRGAARMDGGSLMSTASTRRNIGKEEDPQGDDDGSLESKDDQ